MGEKAVWPESYYLENDPDRRWELLQNAAEKGQIDPQEKALREELWQRRYGKKRAKKGASGDGYIGFWLTLSLNLQDINSRFRRRAMAGEIRRKAEQLGIDATRLEGRERELVDRELHHAMRLFYTTCTEGNYGTQVFGLMRMKADRLVGKIAGDVYATVYLLPQRLEMSERFALLQRAAYDEFCDRYPDSADLLDRLIEEGCAK